MAPTLNEYLASSQPYTVELCGCGCGKPLGKNDPLGPYWIGVGNDKKLINEDCYFEKMGAEIDKHPIGGHGIHGPKDGLQIEPTHDATTIMPAYKAGGSGCSD